MANQFVARSNATQSTEQTPPTSPWFIPTTLTLPPRAAQGPSHSKRRAKTHIPRPRNAFILFRSHFTSMNVLPLTESFCKDHRQVSRIVSILWTRLSLDDRERFYALVEQEQRAHKEVYPLYQIPTTQQAKKNRRRDEVGEKEGSSVDEVRCREIADAIMRGVRGDALVAAVQTIVDKRPLKPNTVIPKSHVPEPIRAVKKKTTVKPKPKGREASGVVVSGWSSPTDSLRNSNQTRFSSLSDAATRRVSSPPRSPSVTTSGSLGSQPWSRGPGVGTPWVFDAGHIGDGELTLEEMVIEPGAPSASFGVHFASTELFVVMAFERSIVGIMGEEDVL